MRHRRISFDCRGRTPSEILDDLNREASDFPNDRRVILLLNQLRDIEGSMAELVRSLVDYFHERRMPASIIDPTGIAGEAYAQFGSSLLVEVCLVESDATIPREILLVDNCEDSLEFMRTLLMEVGHRVSCAESGREALRLHKKTHFDIVLLDLVLPDMDGMEVASHLAESGIPVIAVSAHLDRWDESKVRRAGFKHILAKPFGIPDLLDALRPA